MSDFSGGRAAAAASVSGVAPGAAGLGGASEPSKPSDPPFSSARPLGSARRWPNPFCTRFVRPDAVAYRDPAGGDAARQQRALLQRLIRCRRGLIIGPHGSGKSTLLQSVLPTLRQRFGDVAQVRLSAPAASGLRARWRQAQKNAGLVQVHQAGLRDGGLLIVDGMEQLSGVARLRVLAAARRRRHHVLGTSHRRLNGFTELFRTEVTESLVESLAESLLADAAAEVASVVRRELSQRDLARIANVRDLWFEMYDVVAKMEAHSGGGRG